MALNSHLDLVNDKNVEQCIIAFLEKVDSIEKSKVKILKKCLPPARMELKTLQLWRATISECLASFLYVFIVCGAVSTAASAGSFPQMVLGTAIASGFTICILMHCFQGVSDAHMNPAITISMVISQKISIIKGVLFVVAQSGGSIAGAALLYGVSPAHYGNLNATISQIPSHMTLYERFSIEFVLTFLIVFTYHVTMNGYQKWLGDPAIFVGFAYLATGLVSMSTQNPIRAFGPSFIMNRWDHHWVFWLGPCIGGIVAVFVFEVMFRKQRKCKRSEISIDGDLMSVHSETDLYNDFGKCRSTAMQAVNSNSICKPKLSGFSHSNTYNSGYCAASLHRNDRNEPIYEGSRSLYTKSPPLTRANLNRSQSVYSKTVQNYIEQKDGLRCGPLYPTQSLYLNSAGNSFSNSQNYHQLPHRKGVENIYGSKYNNRDTRESVDTYNKDTKEGRDIYNKDIRDSKSSYNKDIKESRDIYCKLPGRNEYLYSSVKNQDMNDNAYNSYVSSDTNSKMNSLHQNSSILSENCNNSYYRNQPSLDLQY